jgi:hypothetical protein
MAFPRIEIYARARALTGDEDLVVSQGGVLRKASTDQIKTFVGTSGGGSVVASDLGLVLWTGDVQPAPPAYGIGCLVTVNPTTGRLGAARADADSPRICVGAYALDSAGNVCVRTSGEIAALGGPFTPGAIVYLAESTPTYPEGGLATETPPTTPGSYRQVVGYATSEGKLFVQPGIIVLNDG